MEIAGITESLEKGLKNLPALDPFNDIEPMVNLSNEEPNMDVFLNASHEDLVILGFKRNEDIKEDGASTDDDDDVYEPVENRSFFDILTTL